MTSSSLGAALEHLENCGDSQKSVFAHESKGGARVYELMTPRQAWKRSTQTKSPHMYEVLSRLCNLYLDVEWITPSRPDLEHESSRVDGVVDDTLTALERVHHIPRDRVDVHRTTASGPVDAGFKCSWHIHFRCKDVCWSDAGSVGAFVRAELHHLPHVDKVPYNAPRQNWRCVGSSKASAPHRPFRPRTQKDFVRGLVTTQAADRAHVIPAPDSLKRPVRSPIPDSLATLVATLGNMRVESAHMLGDRYLCVPFRQRVPCAIADRVHSSNHQFAIVDTVGLRWRMRCHNAECAQVTDMWRLFPDIQEAIRHWRATAPPTTPVAPPAVPAAAATAALLRPRIRGPPPLHLFDGLPLGTGLKCRNGVFIDGRAMH
jgi:hypothetical protein